MNKYLLDTWASHSQFEQQITQLKAYIETQAHLSGDTANTQLLTKIGEDLESTAHELRKSVTNAINEVDSTKLQIMSYLDIDDCLRLGQVSVFFN